MYYCLIIPGLASNWLLPTPLALPEEAKRAFPAWPMELFGPIIRLSG